jgi:hypothetical protein
MHRSRSSLQPYRPLLLNLISKPQLQYMESENVIGIRTVAYRWHYEEFLSWNHISFFTFLLVIFTVTIQCKQNVLQSGVINLTA